MREAGLKSETILDDGRHRRSGPWLAREIVNQFGSGSLTCLIPKTVPAVEEKSLAYLRRLGVECLECNLMKSPNFEGSLPAVDVLIHMAANTRTDLPEHALQVNTMGTKEHPGDFSRFASREACPTSTSAAIDRGSFPEHH